MNVETAYGLMRFDLYKAGMKRNASDVAVCDLVVEWINDQVIAKHPHLGGRHVCPGLPESIKRMALWIGRTAVDESFEIARDQLVAWGQRYWKIPPTDSENAAFKAVILVLEPDIDRARIQSLKNAAKMDFVRQGLMVGTFNPEERGARFDQAKNWPPRSPVPLWSIRQMIKSDLRFLASNPAMLAEYNLRFGNRGTPQTTVSVTKGDGDSQKPQ